MKKKSLLFAALVMAMSLMGCQGASNNDVQNTETESEIVNTTETETETESETEEIDPNALSQEKIDWFETAFFNGEEDWITNMFLTSEYTTPEDIDLNNLFYGGANGRGGAGEVPEEEIELLLSRYNQERLDVSKATVAQMNEVLQKYTGLTLEETNKVNLEYLLYLEEYDAYYKIAGDTNYIKCDILAGWTNEDGTLTLQYCNALSSPSDTWEVTLQEVDGSYQFVSNKLVTE